LIWGKFQWHITDHQDFGRAAVLITMVPLNIS
jgi:hypothetical protein